MDDFLAALLCLPFLIPPVMVLLVIIASKIKDSGMVKAIRFAMRGGSVEGVEIIPCAASTDIPSGCSGKNRCLMPVEDYIAETMQSLKTQRTPTEVNVKRVDQSIQRLSQIRLPCEAATKS
jgi:short-subunit dehydrogenase involved in D-alanine esterification of teichoic acids